MPNIQLPPLWSKRVFDMTHRRNTTVSRQHHFHDIEPYDLTSTSLTSLGGSSTALDRPGPPSAAPSVFPCPRHPHHFPSLGPGHGLDGRAVIHPAPRLDLNEGHHIAPLDDEIYFKPSDPETVSENPIAVRLEELPGGDFTVEPPPMARIGPRGGI
jgi:hypothetical protein